MVEDPELPFPESLAASEIHKAGQAGARAAKYLFYNIGFGALVYLCGVFNLFAPDKDFFFNVGRVGQSKLRLGGMDTEQVLGAGGVSTGPPPLSAPRSSASATSSGRNCRRSTSRAAWSPGDSSSHC